MIYWYFGNNDFIGTSYVNYKNSVVFKTACMLIFLGFGVKIPVWPFHFWLTKTHVEASTAFSIFLSGILVKTAVLGLVKFKFIFLGLNQFFIFFIIGYGVIDASLKLYSQVDFKKLIAYATVQEMSIMVMFIVFDSFFSRLALVYFCFFHTLISGLFFYINDMIYKRFGTRHINNVSGLINTQPLLASILVTSLFLFIGLPFTIKFYIEIQLLYRILSINLFFGYIFIFMVQYASIVFFFKNTIVMVFGPIQNNKKLDVSKKELSVVIFFLSGILLLCFIV